MAPPPHCFDTQQNGTIEVVVDSTTSQQKLHHVPNLVDADDFRRQGHQVIDFIAEYYERISDYPVNPRDVTPGFLRNLLPTVPPSRPEPDAFSSALRDVRDVILPGLTHWQSPRHIAHFPASSSTVGALGEALTAGINVVPFTWAASPAATELEIAGLPGVPRRVGRRGEPRALVAALGTEEQEYILGDAAAEGHDVVDYKDWGVTLTRRFRALKLWLVLRCYGTDGLRGHIRSHVRMAEAFEGMVRPDARFEVVTRRRFALVCFRLLGGGGATTTRTANDLNRRLLEQVNAVRSGPYLSSAKVGGMYVLRCALGSTLTEERHVKDVWNILQYRASLILLALDKELF
ncbi:unnamed protein product [Alopecurus aequalis]